MYRRPYLDSSVFIAGIQDEAGRSDTVRRIFQDAQNGRFPIFASTFVVVEVVRDRDQPIAPESVDTLIENFLEQPFITWIELDVPLARQARHIARTYGLRPADSVHVASAIRAGCDEHLIWDDRVPKGPLEGVVVAEPYWQGQGDLGLAR